MFTSSRRAFLQSGSLAVGWAASHPLFRMSSLQGVPSGRSLDEFGYGDVTLQSELHENQLQNTHSVLMNLSEDSMLKPLRQMSGLPLREERWMAGICMIRISTTERATAGLLRLARLGNGFPRWRGLMPSARIRRRGKR